MLGINGNGGVTNAWYPSNDQRKLGGIHCTLTATALTFKCDCAAKTLASAGNRTRAARVAGEHSTTEPPMPTLAWEGNIAPASIAKVCMSKTSHYICYGCHKVYCHVNLFALWRQYGRRLQVTCFLLNSGVRFHVTGLGSLTGPCIAIDQYHLKLISRQWSFRSVVVRNPAETIFYN